MKRSTIFNALAVAGLCTCALCPCFGQTMTPGGVITPGGTIQAGGGSVKRHPKDVLHYQVKFESGDAGKLTGASLHFQTKDSPPANQEALRNNFGGGCGSPVSPEVFQCAVTIPDDISNGTYRLFEVDAGTPIAGATYHQDFGVPEILIENPNTFTKPSKVTVTEKP